MKPEPALFLFLVLLASGCLGAAPDPTEHDEDATEPVAETEEPPVTDPAPSSDPLSQLDWKFELDNETLIARFEISQRLNITFNKDWDYETVTMDEWDSTKGVFILGGGYHFIARDTRPYMAQVDEHDVSLPVHWEGGGYGWAHPGPTEPGEYVLAFVAQNTNATVHVTSESAYYEILPNETMILRKYRWDHPDWDATTVMVTDGASYFNGTIDVAPLGKHLQIHGHAGIFYPAEAGTVRAVTETSRESCRDQEPFIGINTDRPVTIDAEIVGSTSNPIYFMAVHWSLPHDNLGCWRDTLDWWKDDPG